MRQVILNFHGLGAPGLEVNPDELPYWISAEMFIDILQLVQEVGSRVRTSFTFDDGNLSDLLIGTEGLAQHGHKAQIFVLSSRLGQPGYLAPADLITLQRMGHKIGTHGADHVDWTAQGDCGLDRELGEARTTVERSTKTSISTAAIPFGRYNRRVLTALKQHGYRHVYSSDGGAWRDGQYPTPRTSPRSDMTLTDIESVLLGRESPKRRMRRTLAMAIKRWK